MKSLPRNLSRLKSCPSMLEPCSSRPLASFTRGCSFQVNLARTPVVGMVGQDRKKARLKLCSDQISRLPRSKLWELQVLKAEFEFAKDFDPDSMPEYVNDDIWLKLLETPELRERLQILMDIRERVNSRRSIAQKAESGSLPVIAGFISNSTEEGRFTKSLKRSYRKILDRRLELMTQQNIFTAISSEPSIAIDMGFLTELGPNNRFSFCQQTLAMLYTNFLSRYPAKICLCDLPQPNEVKNWLSLISSDLDFSRWKPLPTFTASNRSVQDTFPGQKVILVDQLAEEPLTHYDPETVYVICPQYSRTLSHSKFFSNADQNTKEWKKEKGKAIERYRSMSIPAKYIPVERFLKLSREYQNGLSLHPYISVSILLELFDQGDMKRAIQDSVHTFMDFFEPKIQGLSSKRYTGFDVSSVLNKMKS